MANRFSTKQVLKKTKFCNEDIEIAKLTVAQVLSVQESAKSLTEGDERGNINLLVKVIRLGAPEIKDMPDEEFNDFPMDELTKLSNDIMRHSGLLK